MEEGTLYYTGGYVFDPSLLQFSPGILRLNLISCIEYLGRKRMAHLTLGDAQLDILVWTARRIVGLSK